MRVQVTVRQMYEFSENQIMQLIEQAVFEGTLETDPSNGAFDYNDIKVEILT